MSEDQQVAQIQLVKINSAFTGDNIDKFLKGQKEHGGDFFKKPTVNNIREEAIDLVNYVHVLRLHKQELLLLVDSMCEERANSPNDIATYQQLLLLHKKIQNL